MFRRFSIGIVAASCLLLVSTLASAQQIAGTVSDSTGLALPGVTATATSPALIEQQRIAVSDGSGEYAIVNLVPGIYTVTFTLPGFSTFERVGIELIGEATANVEAVLQVGSIQETITVTGASPLVDVQNVAKTMVMTREVMDTVPSSKTYSGMGVLVPGMTIGTTYGISQDVGGQSGQSSMRMSIHGGDQTDQRMLMDGMAVNTWTQEDGSALWFSDGNLEEMQIQHSAITAEVETGGVNFNLIPRAGGNTFSSRTFLNYSHENLQSSNVDDQLIADGLPEFEGPNGLEPAINRSKDLWGINPSIGGPIVRDRLWFFGSYTRNVANSYVAFLDDVDPNALTYTAGNTQTVDDQDVHDIAFRLTAQVSPNNKLQFYADDNSVCHCHFLVGTAIGTNVMQSGAVFNTRDIQLYQGNWTSTLSNRLLVDAAFSSMVSNYPFNTQPDVDSTLPGVIDAGVVTRAHRGISSWYPPGRKNWLIFDNTVVGRASLSYVTGSHSAKFGTSITRGNSDRIQDGYTTNAQIINLYMRGATNPQNGSDHGPLRATFNSFPLSQTDTWESNYIWTIGTYAQDQWTTDRMTLNLGVRWDYFQGGYPDHAIPEAPFAAAKIFPGATPVGWNDLSPRLGIVYDVRGDGRTALKATASRYVTGYGTTLVGNGVNPALLNSSDAGFGSTGSTGTPVRGFRWVSAFFPAASRPHRIRPRQAVSPATASRSAIPPTRSPTASAWPAQAIRAFGTLATTAQFDEDWAKGWGKRRGNWEFSGGVQHELTDGLSMNATVFRRVFVNYDATNNPFQIPGEYNEYCVTVPSDPGKSLGDLPGAGTERCGYFDINPDAFGQIQTLRTSADNFGERTNHWIGADFTVDARMDNGLVLQGGVSSGRKTESDCDLIANLNSPGGAAGRSRDDCERQEPWLTQVKMIGSYTLPGDWQLSGVFQSIPGLPYSASASYAANEVRWVDGVTRTSLETAGGARTSMCSTGPRAYTDRLLQVDLRVTKIFNVGPSRIRLMVDLYNAFNDNTVLKFNNNYGGNTGGGANWLNPQLIIPARLLKFGAQLDF